MKRICISLVFGLIFVGASHAVDTIIDKIGPTHVSQNTAMVTISDPGANLRNCLSEFSINVGSASIVRILDGGTTTYAVELATNTFSGGSTLVAQPYRMTWPLDDPFCSSNDQTMNFTIMTWAGGTTSYKLSYRGYVRGDR